MEMGESIYNSKIAPKNLIYGCAFPHPIQPYPVKIMPHVLRKGLPCSDTPNFSIFCTWTFIGIPKESEEISEGWPKR